MSNTLAWGILGTGTIAHIFARGLAASHTGRLIAVGSRTQEAAEAFGEKWPVSRRYGSYEQVLADKEVQAVYISTPHPFHAEWTIKAIEVGKHVLCEKPLAMNVMQARAIIEAAQQHNVFLMEAFMYRCHPQTARILELLRAGTLGSVRVIQATFSFQADYNPRHRLFDKALGGGSILDVGGYCVSMARLIAGVATGKDVAEPLLLKGVAHFGETDVDEYALASLLFPDGIMAQLWAGIQVLGENSVRIYGSEGSLYVPVPWVPAPMGGTSSIFVRRNGEEMAQEITIACSSDIYALEADTVATHLDACQAPAMPWHDTLGNMRTLDRWRASIGLAYDSEHSM